MVQGCRLHTRRLCEGVEMMDYSDNFKTQLDLEAEGVDNKTNYNILMPFETVSNLDIRADDGGMYWILPTISRSHFIACSYCVMSNMPKALYCAFCGAPL